MNIYFVVGGIIAILLLFSLRSLSLQIIKTISRTSALLDRRIQTSSLSPLTVRLLPANVRHGHKFPDIFATNIRSRELIKTLSNSGKSIIVAFFKKREFERWELTPLLAFLNSCWYRIEGDIYIILSSDEVPRWQEIPHGDILEMEIGQHLVLGACRPEQLKGVLGISKTPCVIELDASAVVRKIGFLTTTNERI
ncbi:MAG: hypothetical protein OXG88_07450 [Gammaproteobacteria bacterium]|nr:hypothetical protein [Gammaproteobacteria bacterium]